MTAASLAQSWTELTHRSADGIEVSLLWDASNGGLAVVVADVRSDETFLLTASQENALDVFYHPYAYAAREGARYLASEADARVHAAA